MKHINHHLTGQIVIVPDRFVDDYESNAMGRLATVFVADTLSAAECIATEVNWRDKAHIGRMSDDTQYLLSKIREHKSALLKVKNMPASAYITGTIMKEGDKATLRMAFYNDLGVNIGSWSSVTSVSAITFTLIDAFIKGNITDGIVKRDTQRDDEGNQHARMQESDEQITQGSTSTSENAQTAKEEAKTDTPPALSTPPPQTVPKQEETEQTEPERSDEHIHAVVSSSPSSSQHFGLHKGYVIPDKIHSKDHYHELKSEFQELMRVQVSSMTHPEFSFYQKVSKMLHEYETVQSIGALANATITGRLFSPDSPLPEGTFGKIRKALEKNLQTKVKVLSVKTRNSNERSCSIEAEVVTNLTDASIREILDEVTISGETYTLFPLLTITRKKQ